MIKTKANRFSNWLLEKPFPTKLKWIQYKIQTTTTGFNPNHQQVDLVVFVLSVTSPNILQEAKTIYLFFLRKSAYESPLRLSWQPTSLMICLKRLFFWRWMFLCIGHVSFNKFVIKKIQTRLKPKRTPGLKTLFWVLRERSVNFFSS